jgi:uncharacterized RDD family membrane protein YckC
MQGERFLDAQAHVETPENVRLSFRLAGPGTRLGAYLIDLAIRIAIVWVLSLALGAIAPIVLGAGLSIGLLLVVIFLVEWFYGCLFEGLWSGRTPGKWMVGLRVIKEGGYPIGFYDAAVRNLLRAADALPVLYGVAFVTMMVTRRMQRLGDLMAGTIVVREERQLLRAQIPFLASVPVIMASDRRVAFRPSDRTLDLIERFFLRHSLLAPSRSDEIARILAAPLADQMGLTTDLQDVGREPSRFLLRVLRTFSEVGDAKDLNAAAPRDPTRAVGVLLEGRR